MNTPGRGENTRQPNPASTSYKRLSGQGFAVWMTGLPGSGKSTLAGAVKKELEKGGVRVAVLESDVVRNELRLESYGPNERELFYTTLVYLGQTLAENGVNVIFDATANRRMFREKARKRITKFMEVYVSCPLEECMRRDPKGIYARARKLRTGAVPGLQEVYEPPLAPEITVDSERESPEAASERIVKTITEKFLSNPGTAAHSLLD